MHIDSLVYADTKKSYKPAPVTQLCKRVRFRQSECRECVDICPTEAISLTYGPVIGDNCINCGLCQIACPTETFEGEFNTDVMLKEYLQSEHAITDGNLYVHCSEAQPHTKTSFGIRCAGNITENGMLAATKYNVKQLRLSTGDCKQCRLYKGMQLFQQAVNTYKHLARSVCNEILDIKTRAKPKPAQAETAAVSRRVFFKTISDSVVKHAAQGIVEKERAIHELLYGGQRQTDNKRVSPRRAALRQLVGEIKQRGDTGTASAPLPWKAMRVDEPKCVGCGICVTVCPTGALEKQTDAVQLTRYINHGLCTNCGLCSEACPHGIIGFERAYTIDDIIDDGRTVVAKVPLNSCLFCGEIVPVSEGEVCTTCQKRRLIPLFVKPY
ncbi:MAG TPA: 4Fe-4S binding protein [Gammaproteobacteria bacterium]